MTDPNNQTEVTTTPQRALADADLERRSTTAVVIGGGPGGYVAGIRLGQLGVETILVEPEPLGGTCLNVGCIPSKALIHAADEFARMTAATGPTSMGITTAGVAIDLAATTAWKDGIVADLNAGVATLLAAAGTDVIRGRATLIDGKTCDVAKVDPTTGDPTGERVIVQADHVVIATGSRAIELPGLPFGGPIISSTEALALTDVPRSVAVVGGGYIGLELGTALAKLGTHVTVVEAEDRILPQYDRQLTAPVARRLAELDVSIVTSARAEGLGEDGLAVAGKDGPLTVAADLVLVTVGRRPDHAGLGIHELGLTMAGNAIAIDDRCHTSMRNVWAIGDVTGEPMLAHRAMAQAEVVAHAIAGRPSAVDHRAIPAIVFTDPEIVTVGLDPDTAANHHGPERVITGRFPLAANGRTMTLDSRSGFVRITARSDDHLVLGIQAVGAGVAELAAAFSLAVETGVRLEDVAGTMHAHPTVGEGLHEAALAALGLPLHTARR